MIFLVLLDVALAIVCNCREYTRECQEYCAKERQDNGLSKDKPSNEITDPGKGNNQAKNAVITADDGKDSAGSKHTGTLKDFLNDSFNIDTDESKRSNVPGTKNSTASNTAETKISQTDRMSGSAKEKTAQNDKTVGDKRKEANKHEKGTTNTLKQSNLVGSSNMKNGAVNFGSAGLSEQARGPNNVVQSQLTVSDVSHNAIVSTSPADDLTKSNLTQPIATNQGTPVDKTTSSANVVQATSNDTKKSLLGRGVRLGSNGIDLVEDQAVIGKSNLLGANGTENRQTIPENLRQSSLNEIAGPSLIPGVVMNAAPAPMDVKMVVKEESYPDSNPTLIQLPAKPPVAINETPQKILVACSPPVPSIPNDVNRTSNDILAQLITLINSQQNPNTIARPGANAGGGIDTEHRYLRNSGMDNNQANYNDTQCKNDVSCMQIKDLQMGGNKRDSMEDRQKRNSDPCLFYKMLVDYSKDINFLSPDMKKELNRIKSKFIERYRSELKSCLGMVDEIGEVRTRYATKTKGIFDGIVDFFKDNSTNSRNTERPGLLFDEINNVNGLGSTAERLDTNSELSENSDGWSNDITITRYVTLDGNDKLAILGSKTITKTVTVSEDLRSENEEKGSRSNDQVAKRVYKRDISQDNSPKERENGDADNNSEKNSQNESYGASSTKETGNSYTTSTVQETSAVEKTSTVTQTLTKSTTITITQDSSSSYSFTSQTHENAKSSYSDSTSLHTSSSSSPGVSNTNARTVSGDNLDILSFMKRLDANNYTTAKDTNGNNILESIYSIIIEIKNDEVVGKTKSREKSVSASTSTDKAVSTLTIMQTVDKQLIGQTGRANRNGMNTTTVTKTIEQPVTPRVGTINNQENILKEIREEQKLLIEKLKDFLDQKEQKKLENTQPASPKMFDSIYSTVDIKTIKPAIENMKKSIGAFKKEFKVDSDINIEIVSKSPSIGFFSQTLSVPDTIYSSVIADAKEHRTLSGSDTETISLSVPTETVEPENSMQYYKTIVLRHKSGENDKENIKIRIEDKSESNSDVEKVVVSGEET